MRDLHLSPTEIGELTYPQAFVFAECIRESNDAMKNEIQKRQALSKVRGR